MTVSAAIDQLSIIALMALLIDAAITDFRQYVIPNAISLAVALLYPVHVLASPETVAWAPALLTGASVFAVGTLAFALRLAGGGDVKLFAALSLWAGPTLLPATLLLTALAGGLLSLAMMGRLLVAGRPTRYVLLGDGVTSVPMRKHKLPYAIAIAAGGLWLALHLLGM